MSLVKGKIALVTGGASGIGLSCIQQMLKNGLKAVAVVDIDDIKGKEIINSLNNTFGENKAIFIKTDVTDSQQFAEAFKITVRTFNGLDIVINNAGIFDETKWKTTVDLNLTSVVCGTLLALEEYLPKYKTGNEGIIVNIASILGLDPHPALPVYSATKHGVIGLTRAFGVEEHYQRTKVRILAICPGYTDTPLLMKPSKGRLRQGCNELFNNTLPVVTIQPVDRVGEALITVINEGSNGSIWVAEDNNAAYEVSIPTKQLMRKE